MRRTARCTAATARTCRRPRPDTLLRFPGKAIELPGGNLLVSDSARHSLAELTPDAETLVRRIGSGERGEPFNEPQGLLLLPADVAATTGYDVLVADTVDHQLRGVRLDTGEVTLVAGTGRPWRSAVDGHRTTRSPPTCPRRGTWPGSTTR